jgi:DNA polymerase-3 subunit gamma/tau
VSAPTDDEAVQRAREPEAETPSSRPAKPKKLSDVAPTSGEAKERQSPPRRPTAGAGEGRPPAKADEAPTRAPAPANQEATATASLEQFVSMWPAVLEALKEYSRVAWMSFASSAPISVSGGELAVALPDAGTVKGVRNSGHEERVRQAILDVMRVDVRVDPVVAPDRVTAPRAARVDPPQQKPEDGPAPQPSAPESDAPSPDDPDVDNTTGVDLVVREFGATQIGEIEH